MPKRKVCANCKFYRDASCSHYWIDRPEQQTCEDFRQNEPEQNGKERTAMTEEQFRYLVKIVRQRTAEEDAKLTESVRTCNFETASFHAGKSGAFHEMLFWMHGMSTDDTEDAFK